MNRRGLTLVEVLVALASLALIAPLVASALILARTLVARGDARLAALATVDLLARCGTP